MFSNLIVSIILIFLTGCKADNGDGKVGSSEKVKIEFFHYKSEAKDTFDKLIAKFEEENPNIDVVNVNPPDAETVLKTRVAKRDIPDIVAIGANSTFAELSKAGVFVDVTSASELDSIQSAYIDMLRDVTGLEKVYAIPLVQYVFQSEFGTDYNLAFASYLMALSPMIIVYLFAQKWIISGVTRGAIK
ncbi:ABC transporter substrate-binding protein [Anoxybacillus sp. TBDG-1]